MKKLKFYILVLFSMLCVPFMVQAKDEIKVYIFKSSSCPHCAAAMEFFQELEQDSEYGSYFELVPYETNGRSAEIQENIALAKKVAKHFGEEFSGVPVIVIGDKYYEGYASSMDSTLKDLIKSAYESDSYEDVVKGIQNGDVKSSNFDAVFTVLIVVVLVGGIAYFIYAARQNTEEEEVILSEEKEEVKEQKPAQNQAQKKKSNSKNSQTQKKSTSKKAQTQKSTKNKR